MVNHIWQQLGDVGSVTWTCGHCNKTVAERVGYTTNTLVYSIRACPSCALPTFFNVRTPRMPVAKPGSRIEDLPADVETVYEEARSAITVGAYSGAVMLFRKLLMHIAADKTGAVEGSFKKHVDALCAKSLLPPQAVEWLSFVREDGNRVNHELVTSTREQAETLLEVTMHVLRSLYEVPARVARARGNTGP